jgi:predicted aconitase with swiveling domain
VTPQPLGGGEGGPIVVRGRQVYPGVAEGIALVCDATLPGWDTFDLSTGKVKERGHLLGGHSVKDRVLIVAGARGSTGWATQFLQLRIAGMAPAAMIFPTIDARVGAACVVTKVPVIADFEEDIFEMVRSGDHVTVNADHGIVTIIRADAS